MATIVPLRVFLTGRVAVETDGAVIDEAQFAGRQGRLVFAYLVPNGPAGAAGRARRGALGRDAAGDLGQGADGDRQQAPRRARGRRTRRPGAVLTAAFGCYRLDLPEGTWVDLFAAASGARTRRRERSPQASSTRHGRRPSRRSHWRAGRSCPVRTEPWVEREATRARRHPRSRAERALPTRACVRATRAEATKWAEEMVALSSRFARLDTGV